jgi:hypothetical protein
MLANGFYKRLDDVPGSELEVVCYGIPRSGSTLIYQLISGVYSEGVAKTHRYCPHRVKTTVSFRDFRDVVVSLWRRSNPTKLDHGMTVEDVEKFTATCRQRIEELDRYFERGGICPLRYEDFAPDPALVFSALERSFGVVVAPETAAELIAQYSIEKNAAIAQKLGNFKSIDPASQIHGNHIFRGEIGGWRQFVTGSAAERLEELLEEPLRRYGYEASPR